MKKILTFAEIEKTDDVKYDEVPVPEWGEDAVVRLRSLSAGKMVEFTEANKAPEAERVSGVRLILMSMVDENGDPVADGASPEALLAKNVNVVNRLAEAAMKLNGMDKATPAALGNASSAAGTGASPSA